MHTADSPPTEPPLRRLLRLLDRHWFYLALAASFGVGWLAPSLGRAMDEIGMMPWLVAFAFFLNGLTLSTESLVGGLRQWPLFMLAMVNTFILPLILVMLAFRLFPVADSALGIGLLMLAVMPTTLVSAVVLTRVAGGNGAVALYITVLANLLAILLVPLLLRAVLGEAADRQIALWGTALKLAYTVLLPTVVGQVLRLGLHRWADRRRRALGVVSQVAILLFVVNGMASLPRGALSPAVWGGVLLAGVLLHVLLLLTAEGGGRLLRADVPTRRAFSLSTSEKSLAVAVALSKQLFPTLGGMVLFPAIVYYVAQLIIDNILAHRWGKKVASD
ncbi:MAG: bile acid:sodium symporter [Armatimonadota bacterium]